ncbi:MAG: hypothetical protein JWR26_159 [Pedosphaera sp.]|nr:hypothetical protein [Pedosphaera sp.]
MPAGRVRTRGRQEMVRMARCGGYDYLRCHERGTD